MYSNIVIFGEFKDNMLPLSNDVTIKKQVAGGILAAAGPGPPATTSISDNLAGYKRVICLNIRILR